MDPTQNNGFGSSNGFGSAMPSGGVGGDAFGGGVPGMSNGDALGGDVGGVQPMTLGGQMAMSGAQPMMTGGQPMMTGGQAMVPGGVGAPVSSGTGDIVLAPEKKSKKWWIVGVVGVIIIMIVACCWWLSVNKDGMPARDTRSIFDEFEKHMLLGGVKEEDIDENGELNNNSEDVISLEDVSLNSAYYVGITESAGYEEQRSFFEKSNELLDSLEKATSSEPSRESVKNLKNTVGIMEQLSVVLNTDYLLQKYMQDPVNGLTGYLDEIWYLSSGSYGGILDGFRNLVMKYKTWYDALLDRQCMRDGRLDGDCIDEALENDSEIGRLWDEIQTMIYNNGENLRLLRRIVFELIENIRGQLV